MNEADLNKKYIFHIDVREKHPLFEGYYLKVKRILLTRSRAKG